MCWVIHQWTIRCVPQMHHDPPLGHVPVSLSFTPKRWHCYPCSWHLARIFERFKAISCLFNVNLYWTTKCLPPENTRAFSGGKHFVSTFWGLRQKVLWMHFVSTLQALCKHFSGDYPCSWAHIFERCKAISRLFHVNLFWTTKCLPPENARALLP